MANLYDDNIREAWLRANQNPHDVPHRVISDAEDVKTDGEIPEPDGVMYLIGLCAVAASSGIVGGIIGFLIGVAW